MCLLEEACVWEWDVGTGLMGYVFMAVLQVLPIHDCECVADCPCLGLHMCTACW